MNLAIFITRILGLIAIIALVGVLALSFCGRPVPDWVGNIVSASVGALSGALVSRHNPDDKAGDASA